MQYTILVYETDSELEARNDPARKGEYWAAYRAYGQALREAGVLRGGHGLQPPHDATSLRVRSGKRQVQDGPFVDTKEKLGGIYIIEVDDLDRALEWASRCPSASTGSVEVRPHIPPMPQG